MNRPLCTLMAFAALLGLAACGGSSSVMPGAASGSSPGLNYTNPTLTQGQLALVRDSASTGSALVLDLVLPEDSQNPTPALGVTFGFQVDTTRAAWFSSPVANGSLFTTGSGGQVVRGWVQGGQLQGIVSNKGYAAQVGDIGNAGGAVIARITLAPVQGGASGTVQFTDNGLGTILDSSGTPYPVTVSIGTLTLQ